MTRMWLLCKKACVLKKKKCLTHSASPSLLFTPSWHPQPVFLKETQLNFYRNERQLRYCRAWWYSRYMANGWCHLFLLSLNQPTKTCSNKSPGTSNETNESCWLLKLKRLSIFISPKAQNPQRTTYIWRTQSVKWVTSVGPVDWLSNCLNTDTFLLALHVLCAWLRWTRTLYFQHDLGRENRLRADITPHCDSGSRQEATHTSLPSLDTCPATSDVSASMHTQTFWPSCTPRVQMNTCAFFTVLL